MPIISLTEEIPINIEDFRCEKIDSRASHLKSTENHRNVLYQNRSVVLKTGIVDLNILRNTLFNTDDKSFYASIKIPDEYIELLDNIHEGLTNSISNIWGERKISPLYTYPYDRDSNTYDRSRSPFIYVHIEDITRFDIFKQLADGIPQWEENVSIETLIKYNLKCEATFTIRSLGTGFRNKGKILSKMYLNKCNVIKMSHRNNTKNTLQYIQSENLTSADPPPLYTE